MTPAVLSKRKLRRMGLCLGGALLVLGGVWLLVACREAARQRDTVAHVRQLGGRVFYNCRYDDTGRMMGARPPGPRWFNRLVGPDLLGHVDGIKLTEVNHLEGLRDFEMPARPCSDVDDESLRHLDALAGLRWLALSRTRVTDAGLAHLQPHSELERLWLDDTAVSDAGLKHLSQLERLDTLSLCRTQVGDAGLVYLAPLVDLKCLRVHGTDCSLRGILHLLSEIQQRSLPDALVTAGLAKCDRSGRIVSLDVSGIRADDDLEFVKRCPRLQWLLLSGTSVGDASLEHFAGLTELTLLDLSGTRVTDAGLAWLENLQKLRDLHVENTGVTDAGIRRLRRRLTGPIRIYRRTETVDSG